VGAQPEGWPRDGDMVSGGRDSALGEEEVAAVEARVGLFLTGRPAKERKTSNFREMWSKVRARAVTVDARGDILAQFGRTFDARGDILAQFSTVGTRVQGWGESWWGGRGGGLPCTLELLGGNERNAPGEKKEGRRRDKGKERKIPERRTSFPDAWSQGPGFSTFRQGPDHKPNK